MTEGDLSGDRDGNDLQALVVDGGLGELAGRTSRRVIKTYAMGTDVVSFPFDLAHFCNLVRNMK